MSILGCTIARSTLFAIRVKQAFNLSSLLENNDKRDEDDYQGKLHVKKCLSFTFLSHDFLQTVKGDPVSHDWINLLVIDDIISIQNVITQVERVHPNIIDPLFL